MQSLSNCQWHFSRNQNKMFYYLYGNTKDPEQSKQSSERKTELDGGIRLLDFGIHYKTTANKTV